MFLRAVPTALAVLFSLVSFAQVAPAQEPGLPGASGASLAVTERHVFVLLDGVLYKVDQRTMRVLGGVRLADGVPLAGRAPAAPRADVPTVDEVLEQPLLVEEPPPPPPEEQPARAGEGATARARALEAALRWLAAHQDENGRWDSDGFMKHDRAGAACDGAGNPTYDVGVTALAMLAMLEDGSTLRAGAYKEPLRKAVRWLRDQQQENGLLGTNASHDFIYNHAIATYALARAYGRSDYASMKSVAQGGINYLESHRNPYSVWRYQPRDNDNDTSVTTWALLAYDEAREHGLQVNQQAMKLGLTWYDSVTDARGRVGYTKAGEPSSRAPGDHVVRFPPEFGEAMTAAGLTMRFELGQSPGESPVMKKHADLLLATMPRWEPGRIDPYYWYFGTRAMRRMGEHWWTAWSTTLDDVVAAQRKDGNCAGSWDPIGVWDWQGGRIYATAMYAMTLATSLEGKAPARAERMR